MILDPTRQPTFTGRRVDPLHMEVDDVCIEDIAHHLSQVNRYNGATPYPYSVGQHSLLVADLVVLHSRPGSANLELAGLLHDASEAYLNDVTTPVKRADLSEGYRAAEWKLQRLIEAVFELPYGLTDDHRVKWADQAATEREWTTWIEPYGGTTLRSLRKMRSEDVEELFLARFADLNRLIERRRHPMIIVRDGIREESSLIPPPGRVC